MEVVLERFHRIEHRSRPIADPRVQAPAGGDQEREAGAGLLVADPNVAIFVERHGILSLHCVSVGEFSAIFASAQPRCARLLLSWRPMSRADCSRRGKAHNRSSLPATAFDVNGSTLGPRFPRRPRT